MQLLARRRRLDHRHDRARLRPGARGRAERQPRRRRARRAGRRSAAPARPRAARPVQPGARVDAVPGARPHRLPADAHRRALDRALRRAREGARHDGAAARRPAADLGADRRQDAPLPRHLAPRHRHHPARRARPLRRRRSAARTSTCSSPCSSTCSARSASACSSRRSPNTQALAFQVGLITSMLPGDPPLRLHLPDPDHAGAAAGRHLPRPGPLLPRHPARDHPQGRGPRHLLAAGRAPSCSTGSPRWRSPRCGSRGGRPERARPLAGDRQGVPADPPRPQDDPGDLRGPDRPDRRLRLRGQHGRDQRAHRARGPGPQRGEPRPGEPLRRVGLLRDRRHRRAGGGGRPLARRPRGPSSAS